MKKFIAAFDGLSFSESTLEYAISFSSLSNAHLVGVFLEDFTRNSYSVSQLTAYEGNAFDDHLRELKETDNEERKKSIEIFIDACTEAGVSYSIHRDRNVALQELLHESIYADLLFINAGETLTKFKEASPSRFVKDLLGEVQCPVLVVPNKYNKIEKIIILYDGEPSSVFALRSFSYLFDFTNSLETQVLTVKENNETMHVPDLKLIREFARRHYPQAEYVLLKGHAEDEIIRYLKQEQKQAVVILGAYKRSRLSRLFRPSMADYLLHDMDIPLFIAHNK